MTPPIPAGDPRTGLSVLYLGGTGVISAACVAACLERGHRVTTVTRGTSERRLGGEVEQLHADVRDGNALRAALGGREFDVVVDVLAFHPDNVRTSLDATHGRRGQYVFISSASAYQTPTARLPITESTPLRNPFWEYSRNKIACEDLLTGAYRADGLPVTIVRPSHTYDATSPPVTGGWTVIERLRRGAPVVVPGDGTSLWTITHARDFAAAFVHLLGNPAAIGEAFHITGDEAPPWNAIYAMLAAAAGVEPRLVHVASDEICAAAPELTGSLLGDKSNSSVFDNTKIKALAPGWAARTTFAEGAREIVAWHDADPSRGHRDPDFDRLCDRLVDGRAPAITSG